MADVRPVLRAAPVVLCVRADTPPVRAVFIAHRHPTGCHQRAKIKQGDRTNRDFQLRATQPAKKGVLDQHQEADGCRVGLAEQPTHGKRGRARTQRPSRSFGHDADTQQLTSNRSTSLKLHPMLCRGSMAIGWAIAIASIAPCALGLVPVVTKVTPNRGYSFGGFRITVEGRNLAFLPDQIDVGVGMQACEAVRVEQPWKSLSCRMPVCRGCTVQQVRVNIAGLLSNAVNFTYTDMCEGKQLLPNRPKLKLPAQYSRAEDCTICRALVSSTIASTPDRVSYESLRLAMRDSCGSPSVRNYRVMDPICKKNIRDYFVPVSTGAMMVLQAV